MHPKLPRALSPARRSSGSVPPWRRPPLLAAQSCSAGLDWQERLEPVPARSPRRRRLAVQHALLTPWAALLQAASLWLALVEASSVLLAQASRQQRAGCGRPATELPRGWLNASAPASARAGLRLEDQQIGETAESTGLASPSRAPGWARQLRREQVMRSAERVIREGEAGGAGCKPTLRGDDK